MRDIERPRPCLWVDAEHVPSGAAGQYGNLLALAARDDRVILTRDRRLLQRREAVGAYLVEAGARLEHYTSWM